MTTATARPKAKPRKTARKKATEPREPTAFDRVGRLASFGIEHGFQIPFLMPAGYDDFTQPVASLHDVASSADRALIHLRVVGMVRHFYGSVPRTRAEVQDDHGGRTFAVAFGDTKEWALVLEASRQGALFVVQPSWFKEEFSLRLVERVDRQWAGRVRPRYPGKPNYMPPDKVREKIHEALPVQLQVAAGQLRAAIGARVPIETVMTAAGAPGWSLEQVIGEVHMPASPTMACLAREALHRVAAFVGLMHAHDHVVSRARVRPVALATRKARLSQLPYTPTAEQVQVVEEIAADMARPVAMKRLLTADVGLGKSGPILVAVAATLDADPSNRVALMAPNTALASQLHAEFRSWFPDLPAEFITGEHRDKDLTGYRHLIGTTALLHRNVGELALVAVDEEQKFSTDQREALTGFGAHMLTATATCIPRTMALARYGALGVSQIRKPHTPRTVHTRRWDAENRRPLFAELRAHVHAGGQVLVVYPMREAREQTDVLRAVDTSHQGWEKMFPGLVRWLDATANDETKQTVLDDMRQKRARILVSTTVVEVGITIPDLQRVVIVGPERMGLSQIHQLRGRVARKGGEGWCDLYCPVALNDDQVSKLDAFLACKDGHEVAELDLKLRGFGDLSMKGRRQSGSDGGILFGSAVTLEHVEPMEKVWLEACGQTVPVSGVSNGRPSSHNDAD